MTNEELVTRIRAGGRDKLPELWEQVERFVAQQAKRRMVLSGGMGGVEVEDLCQSGYIALVNAVDTYDPAAGMSFIGWLLPYLKNAFAEAGGYRTRKQSRDPFHHAGSLGTPIGGGDDNEDDRTLADIQADPAAAQAFQDAENSIWQEQLRPVLAAALDDLPDKWAEALRRLYYMGQTKTQAAEAIGVSLEAVRQYEEKAFRRLRLRRGLRQFAEK